MTVKLPLDVPYETLAKFCRRRHIGRVSVFGSALRPDFRPESDVDLRVEFEPGCTPGWEIIDIEDALSALFGSHPVHTVNPKYLSHLLKDRVLGSAVVDYETPDGT